MNEWCRAGICGSSAKNWWREGFSQEKEKITIRSNQNSRKSREKGGKDVFLALPSAPHHLFDRHYATEKWNQRNGASLRRFSFFLFLSPSLFLAAVDRLVSSVVAKLVCNKKKGGHPIHLLIIISCCSWCVLDLPGRAGPCCACACAFICRHTYFIRKHILCRKAVEGEVRCYYTLDQHYSQSAPSSVDKSLSCVVLYCVMLSRPSCCRVVIFRLVWFVFIARQQDRN